jgi:hypothetical protein
MYCFQVSESDVMALGHSICSGSSAEPYFGFCRCRSIGASSTSQLAWTICIPWESCTVSVLLLSINFPGKNRCPPCCSTWSVEAVLFI